MHVTIYHIGYRISRLNLPKLNIIDTWPPHLGHGWRLRVVTFAEVGKQTRLGQYTLYVYIYIYAHVVQQVEMRAILYAH